MIFGIMIAHRVVVVSVIFVFVTRTLSTLTVYDFRGALFSSREEREISHSDIGHMEMNVLSAKSSRLGPLLRRYASPKTEDHFRLLAIEAGHVLIGAADTLYNISIESFSNISTYQWLPTASAFDDCTMKNVETHACHNYIRIVALTSRGERVVCGTNAYRPRCRILHNAQSGTTLPATISEFSGTGLLPLDPRQNTTVYVDGDFLYAATIADFSGTDALIFRRNVSARGEDRGLRTPRNNDFLLSRPQFVGELHSEEYVYFFFREDAHETDTAATFSRVGRVCKSDKGGPRNYYEAEWTSFVKARLNCSISEKNRPFYFDEIIAISNLLRTPDGREIFYATFVSEFNFLRHSVICAFDLAQIDKLFQDSDLLVLDTDRSSRTTNLGPNLGAKWTRKNREDRVRRLVGQCQTDSRRMSEEDALQLRKYALISDSASSLFARGAFGIRRASDHYGQIAVLPNVEFHDGVADVTYVATNHGNVIKMVNLAHFVVNSIKRSAADESEDPLVPVVVFQITKAPIRSLHIADDMYLVVVTDTAIYRVPLHACGVHTTCSECVASRDPHCVWHNFECTHATNIQKRFAYQDVLMRRGNVCTLAARDGKEARRVVTAALGTDALRIDVATNSRHNVNYSIADSTQCDCTNSAAINYRDCKCGAPQDVELLTNGPTKFFDNLKAFLSSSLRENNSIEEKNLTGSPWWILFIVGFAIIQTFAFLYLCCRLYSTRRRRAQKCTHIANSVSNSASIVSTKQSIGSAIITGTSNSVVSAYSCGNFNGSTMNIITTPNNRQNEYGDYKQSHLMNQSVQNLNYNYSLHSDYSHSNQYYQQHSTARNNLQYQSASDYNSSRKQSKSSNYNELASHYRSAVAIANYGFTRPFVRNKSNAEKNTLYSLADERATALATSATLGRSSATISRMNSFGIADDVTLGRLETCAANGSFYHRNACTLDGRASGRRAAATQQIGERVALVAVDKRTSGASASEDASTMSSDSTNVTHLSSFCASDDVDSLNFGESSRAPTCKDSILESRSSTGKVSKGEGLEPCIFEEDSSKSRPENSNILAPIMSTENDEIVIQLEGATITKTSDLTSSSQRSFTTPRTNCPKSMAQIQNTPSGLIIQA